MTDFDAYFRARIAEWLRTYQLDPKRQKQSQQLDEASIKVARIDARDFIRAMDCPGLVTDKGHGRYRFPLSSASEALFWEHARNVVPRRVTLWLEPLITIAMVGRLHLDYGWPARFLGSQSKEWAFDFVAEHPIGKIVLAGEVKKSSKEIDRLLGELDACTRGERETPPPGGYRLNAWRKWKALGTNGADWFVAVGPSLDIRPFGIRREGQKVIELTAADPGVLSFRGPVSPPSFAGPG